MFKVHTVRGRIIENLNKELELPFSISFVSTKGGGAKGIAGKMRYGNPKAIVKGQKLKMMENIWSGLNSPVSYRILVNPQPK